MKDAREKQSRSPKVKNIGNKGQKEKRRNNEQRWTKAKALMFVAMTILTNLEEGASKMIQ